MPGNDHDYTTGRGYENLRNLDGFTLKAIGDKYMAEAKYDSAHLCYSIVANRPIKSGKDTQNIMKKISALVSLGYLYMTNYFDTRNAYMYFMEALDLAEKYQINNLLGPIYTNMVYVYYYDNILTGSMPQEIVTSAEKAFDFSYGGAHGVLVVSMSNLIELGIELQDTSFVVPRLKLFRSIELSDSVYLKDYILAFCEGMEAYIRHDYPSAAQHFIDATERIKIKVNPKQGVISALSCAAEIFIQSREFDRAEKTLIKAVSLTYDDLNRPMTLSLYKKLMRLYEITGDSIMQQRQTIKYLQLKDSLINSSRIGNSRQTEFQYDLNKAESNMRMLNEKRRLQNIMLITSMIVACIVSLLLFFLYRSYRLNQEKSRIIYQSYQKSLEREEQYKRESAKTSQKKKYKSSTLTDDDTRQLLMRILDVLRTTTEIYNADFNIDRLTELVGAKQSRYVSEAINKETGANFSTLLNKYRIMEACRMFDNVEEYDKFTVEYISESVGFKSRSTFSTVFKSITGLTPSVYKSTAKQAYK